MAMVAGDIKQMLSINIKPRHDTLTDQYNRIYMVKILMISSLIMGVSWFKDSINCIVPDSHGISGSFVSATCWIQGLYVYKELQDKFDVVAYYGMPINMDHDGMVRGTSDLCVTQPQLDVPKSESCEPMTKTFFLQYQYMPFLVAAMAILYYAPYVAFLSTNQDMICLRKDMKSENVDAVKITKQYFSFKERSSRTLILRVLMNILIKLLYFAANLVTLLGLNNVLNKEFISYGTSWTKWSTLDNHIAFDYMGLRGFPKPGNHLLPPFAYCEMYESARDVKHVVANKHKFVCELSQNILYQYVLVVLWFSIVFGIVISAIGLISLLLNHSIAFFGVRPYGMVSQKLLNILTFRELEYLEYIRHRNITIYEQVVQLLRDNIQASVNDHQNHHHNHNHHQPLNSPNAPPAIDDGYHVHPDMHPLHGNHGSKQQGMYALNSLPRKVDS